VVSHSTRTPRFGNFHNPSRPNQVPRPRPSETPRPPHEKPFLPSLALKRRKTQDFPSDHRGDLKKKVHFMTDSRLPMSDRAKHERLQQAKGKEVRHSPSMRFNLNYQDQCPSTLSGPSKSSGPSTSSDHQRHRCSKRKRLGHYGYKCPLLEIQQPLPTHYQPSRNPASTPKTFHSMYITRLGL
jgi:hypothetical protein